MDISDYIKVLRTRWIIIVITTVVATAAALAYSLIATPQYSSTVKLYVSTTGSATSSVSDAYQGNLASQQRVASYTQLLAGESVAQRTIDKLGLTLTPAQLAAKVKATSSPDTVLINVAVTDANPGAARDIANGIGDIFVGFVQELETPPGGGAAIAKVSVVEPAQATGVPVSPNTKRNIALGFAVGLLLGIALAVLRDRLDNTVKERGDLARLAGAPVVGMVPLDAKLAERATIAFATDSTASAEAFRELRTNLQFLEVDNPPRVIVITSAIPTEGKTTTAINTALVLAEAGHRVVLVEGDLRRPRVGKYLGMTSAAGLSNVLAAQADVADVLQPTAFAGLEVLASGPLPPNPSELLGSEAARTTLARLAGMFDYVIVDAPPLLPVTDAAVVAAFSDGAILVARHGHTKGDEVTRAIGNLTQVGVPVIGAVLTMTPLKGKRAEDYRYSYETDHTLPKQGDIIPATNTGIAQIPDDNNPASKATGKPSHAR